jgi:hypothetical protein
MEHLALNYSFREEQRTTQQELRKRKAEVLAEQRQEVHHLFSIIQCILMQSNFIICILLVRQERRQNWQRKLKPFPVQNDNQTCCKKACIKGAIPRVVLERVRENFLKHPNQVHLDIFSHDEQQPFQLVRVMFTHVQVERKRGILEMLDPSSLSCFSVALGAFPICWKGLCFTTGVSTTLLQSVTASPKAR